MADTTQLFDTGQGATMAFTTNSTFTPKVKELPKLKRDCEPLVSSVLATTGDEELVPGDLTKNGEMTIPILWNTNDTLPAINTVDTLTITWAVRTGQTAAATLAGTCIIKGIEITGHKLGELQEGSITIQFDGYTGPTYTKGS